MRIAALLGASGATGQKLLPLLLDDPRYDTIITLGRRATSVRHRKLEDRVVDFENLAAGFEGLKVDDCYLSGVLFHFHQNAHTMRIGGVR